MSAGLTRRQVDLLQMLHDSSSAKHVVAHQTTVGAAMVGGEGFSYPVTIRPLVEEGLVELGDLVRLPSAAWDRWDAVEAERRAYLEARQAWAEAHPEIVAEHAVSGLWKYIYRDTTGAGPEPQHRSGGSAYHRRGRPITLTDAGRQLMDQHR